MFETTIWSDPEGEDHTIIDWLFRQVVSHGWLRRKRWVANPADPTEVIMWWRPSDGPIRRRWFEFKLTGSWGVEALVMHRGRRRYREWRTYDHFVFKWLFSRLEAAHDQIENEREDDPMGRLSDYE